MVRSRRGQRGRGLGHPRIDMLGGLFYMEGGECVCASRSRSKLARCGEDSIRSRSTLVQYVRVQDYL